MAVIEEDRMKLVTAVVRTQCLDEVAQAVSAAGARGMTAADVRGFGQQYGHHGEDRNDDAAVLLLPKLRIDVVVTDELAWPVAEAIVKAVGTGTIGDGKIWISEVEDTVRVRTGERGPAVA
jgi:nitrogen regulatory protein PII